MSWVSYVIAFVTASIATSAELSFRNQRHPFRDKRSKAVCWWCVIAIIDGLVSLAVLAGLTASNVVSKVPSGSPPFVLGIVVGILGPLALRSPVRKSEVKGQESPVGITYVYDIVRLYSIYALDERMTRLKRRDVSDMRRKWAALGVTAEIVAGEIQAHLKDHDQLADDVKVRVAGEVENALTIPEEDQRLDMLIKIVRKERFRSLIDYFSSSPGRS